MASLKEVQKTDAANGNTAFKDTTKAYHEGRLNLAQYKSVSGKYGSFSERGGKKNILRLRNSCGEVTPEKLRFIVDEARKYNVEMIHFATCQTIQFHHLNEDQIFGMMDDVAENGYLTYGTGGDYPRNIMCSPLAGVDPDEVFDVRPYAKKAAEFLTGVLADPKMPRKLKTAFSGDRENITHATYRDLGFVAQDDGTFDVYAAGGLGPNPRFGVKVAEKVQPEDILYYVQAMINTFKKHGAAGGRTRYMVENLGGEDAFRKVFNEELAAVADDLKIRKGELEAITKSGDGTKPSNRSWRIKPQKQSLLYYVIYHPVGGCPDIDTLDELADLVKNMNGVEMRTGPDQTMYIVNLTGKEADALYEAAESDAARNTFEMSAACVGGRTCQVGLRDSQQLLHDLVQLVRQADLSDAALPKIHISGCPSSCSGHQTAEIGLQGTIKMVDRKPEPAFLVSIHGHNGFDDAIMGKPAGVMLEKDIAPFLLELGREVVSSGLDYGSWSREHPTRLDEIAAKYIH